MIKSTSIISSNPSQRLGQSSIPRKRGRAESTSSTPETPLPRLSSIPNRLFLPSAPAPPRFSRGPPLIRVSFYRILVQVTEDFSINFSENQDLEEDQLFLANRVSSQKPELTGTNTRDRVILQSSGWIGEGETKHARYVSHFPITLSCANILQCRLKGLEYAFSQAQPWAKFNATFTDVDNTTMIEHEVGLHYLAVEVKNVFDGALIKCGIRGTPGVHSQKTVIRLDPG